ncbi:MAG: hypothetical protein HY820_15135 [Acidobacteria bacterium]|nr:hypothetical protein [Acidobacteriota bacterium]
MRAIAVSTLAVALVVASPVFAQPSSHEDDITGGTGSVWLTFAQRTVIPRTTPGFGVPYTPQDVWQHQHRAGTGHVLEIVGPNPKNAKFNAPKGCLIRFPNGPAGTETVHIYVEKQRPDGTWFAPPTNNTNDGDIIITQETVAGSGLMVPGHRQLAGLRGECDAGATPSARRNPCQKDKQKVEDALRADAANDARLSDADFLWHVRIRDQADKWDWPSMKARFTMTYHMPGGTGNNQYQNLRLKRIAVRIGSEILCDVPMGRCNGFRIWSNDKLGAALQSKVAHLYPPGCVVPVDKKGGGVATKGGGKTSQQ